MIIISKISWKEKSLPICPDEQQSSGEEKVLPPLFSLSLELSTCQLQTNPP